MKIVWNAFGMAFKQIGRNAMRSFLTTLGITIGVAAVIGMVSLGQSATARVNQDLASLGPNLIFVVPGAGPGSGRQMILKPFDLGELQARLRALIRRGKNHAEPLLAHGALRIDPAARSVNWEGRPVELSTREYAVLHALLLNAGRVLSKAQLEEKLYGWGEEIESNAVEVFVHHLRRKLAPELIRTVRGVGYMIPREAG